MDRILIATIRKDDREQGETVAIYWKEKELVGENNEPIIDGGNINSLKDAVDRAFKLWEHWETFNCDTEY
ncbi:MAG: hypothetical protein WC292_00190 [Clostridia bacterium]